MLRRFLVLIFTICTFSVQSNAPDTFTIFLVRHAEKQSGKDPSLTSCGQQRAQQLSNLLEKAKLATIYSTSFRRTSETAFPSANKQKLPIKYYDPASLPLLAHQLKKYQQNALVVGHSNTTPQLVELLTDKEVPPIAESEYQNIYMIQFVNQQAYLTQLLHPLKCHY